MKLMCYTYLCLCTLSFADGPSLGMSASRWAQGIPWNHILTPNCTDQFPWEKMDPLEVGSMALYIPY